MTSMFSVTINIVSGKIVLLASLIDLCDRISSAFDRREYALGVFLDLSKASDTVNHAILFDKLEHSGLHVWSSTRMDKKLFL